LDQFEARNLFIAKGQGKNKERKLIKIGYARVSTHAFTLNSGSADALIGEYPFTPHFVQSVHLQTQILVCLRQLPRLGKVRVRAYWRQMLTLLPEMFCYS
jgi:hypothetical protein